MRQYLAGRGAAATSTKRIVAAALAVPAAVLALAAWSGNVSVHRGVTGPIGAAVRGKCLSVSGGPSNIAGSLELTRSSGLGLRATIATCNGQATQSWTLPGDNTVRIRGRCLQASNKAPGAGLVVATCNGSDAQFWEPDGIVRVPGDELLNPWSGKCMEDPKASTVNGTQVRLGACTRSVAQTWYLPPAS